MIIQLFFIDGSRKCHDNLEDGALDSNKGNTSEIKHRLFDLLGSDEELKDHAMQNKCGIPRFVNSNKNEEIGCKLDSVYKLHQCTYLKSL